MKLKGFLKYALAGLLLTAAPLYAFATDVNVGNITNTTQQDVGGGGNDTDVGVYIDVTAANTGTVNGTAFTTPPNTITIGGIDVVGFAAPVGTLANGVIGVGIKSGGAFSLGQTTINVGDITLSGENTQAGSPIGGFVYYAAAQAFDGTLKIGNVNVTDNSAVATLSAGVGFIAPGFGGSNISGKVTAGDITVNSIADAAGNTAGFYSGNLTAGAEVKLGKVNVTSTNYADGVWVGDIGNTNTGNTAKLTVGDVNVKSTGGYGYGIDVGVIGLDGSLKAGNVTVSSTAAAARGISVTRIVAPAAGESATSRFEVGEVRVDSADSAVGIDVTGGGPSTFTITKDVVATSSLADRTGGQAVVGIRTDGGNQNLTINTDAGDVQISGTTKDDEARSINMQGSLADTLTIAGKNTHTNKGKVFDVRNAENVIWETNADYVDGSRFVTSADTTHKVATGKTVVINGRVNASAGANSYTVGDATNNKYAGNLVIQRLNTVGNVTVNNGLLALDGSANHSINGALTIGNNNKDAQAPAAVALYGNTKSGLLALALVAEPTLAEVAPGTTNAVVDPITGEKVLSLSSITEYKWDKTKNNGYYASNRERAALSDAFLLPASIHSRLTAWEATRDHFISGGRRAKSGKEFLGQAPCDPCEAVSACDPCEPVCEVGCDTSCEPCDACDSHSFGGGLLLGTSAARSAWVNYVGRSNDYRSSYSNIGLTNGDWQIGTDGVQVGLDLYKTRKAQLGLLFGYEGSVATLRSDRLEADDVYIGVYAARVFRNGADFRVIYNYGSQDYTLRRLDPGLGLNWHAHNSAFKGNTNEVNLEFGKRIFSGRGWSYRPVIGLDLIINNWDGALENGNLSTAVAYGDADITQTFIRFGSDLKYVKGNFEFNSGLYYSYDLNGEELKSAVFARNNTKRGFDNAISSTLYGSDLGRSVLTFNFGGSYGLSECTSVFGGFTGDAILDRDGDGFQSIGYVGLKWKL
jgi:hypothetical protein